MELWPRPQLHPGREPEYIRQIYFQRSMPYGRSRCTQTHAFACSESGLLAGSARNIFCKYILAGWVPAAAGTHSPQNIFYKILSGGHGFWPLRPEPISRRLYFGKYIPGWPTPARAGVGPPGNVFPKNISAGRIGRRKNILKNISKSGPAGPDLGVISMAGPFSGPAISGPEGACHGGQTGPYGCRHTRLFGHRQNATLGHGPACRSDGSHRGLCGHRQKRSCGHGHSTASGGAVGRLTWAFRPRAQRASSMPGLWPGMREHRPWRGEPEHVPPWGT